MPNPFKDWARMYGVNKQSIDRIRTGQLGPAPPGSTPGPGEPGGATRLATSRLQQDAHEIVGVVPHQIVRTVEFVRGPARVVANPFV